MLNGQFGKASGTVVIEEFLTGIELSVFIITDGKNYKIYRKPKITNVLGNKIQD